MKKILVLIDNSINSKHLALSAMNIALTIGASITLVHAAKKSSADDNNNQTDTEVLNELNELTAIANYIKTIASKADKIYLQTNVQCVNYNKSMTDLLAEQTNDGEVHLVIIGSHQSGEWEKVMFRTQMQDILENIGCPLLIIPKKFILSQIRHTVFAVDLSIRYKNALRFMVAFLAPFGARILVNHISKTGFPEKLSEQDLRNSVNLDLDEAYPPVDFHTVRSANVKIALLETIETGKVDLLCLVHKNYNFLSGIFHTSISKQLADNATIPIMILPEN